MTNQSGVLKLNWTQSQSLLKFLTVSTYVVWGGMLGGIVLLQMLGKLQ